MSFIIENHVLLRYKAEPECEKVEIPAGVVGIGENAFRDHTELKEIVLPEGIEWIGPGAFAVHSSLLD